MKRAQVQFYVLWANRCQNQRDRNCLPQFCREPPKRKSLRFHRSQISRVCRTYILCCRSNSGTNRVPTDSLKVSQSYCVSRLNYWFIATCIRRLGPFVLIDGIPHSILSSACPELKYQCLAVNFHAELQIWIWCSSLEFSYPLSSRFLDCGLLFEILCRYT